MSLRGLGLGFVGVLLALPLVVAAPVTNHWRSFTEGDGLPENACVSVSVGAAGNILVRHAKAAAVSVFDGYEFSSVPAPDPNRSRIFESPGGQLWTVASDGLLEFREGQWTPHAVPQIAAHFRAGDTNEIRLQPVRQGRVLIFLPDEWLQFDVSGPAPAEALSLPRTNSQAVPLAPLGRPASLPAQHVYDAATDAGGNIWFATSEGLLRQTRELWEATAPAAATDVAPRAEFTIQTTTNLPPGDWQIGFTARNGDRWFGGLRGLARQQQGTTQFFLSTNQLGPEEVLAFAEAPDGRLWCGTPRKVWEFNGKNWLTLRGGFESINALHYAPDGTLWVATTNGLYRCVAGVWIANSVEDGLPAADIRRIAADGSGRIMVETAWGWSAFHPEVDAAAPRTYIVTNVLGEAKFREGAVVTIPFGGRDKWKQTSPERLLFSYRLDERDWSPFQELNEVLFTDLPLGKHYFQVRAMDRAGNIDPRPARLEFTVIVPWYRETRLVLILALALAVAVFFAALAMNRHRKLQRSYAEVERQVAERTRELEIANRELLHSQKMNALGSLAAGIAHDFNNILSIVKGSAQIIEDNADQPDKIRTRVDRIKIVVQQGAEVVDAMLGFSRSTDQPPAPCDLNVVVDETRKLLGDRFLREVEVRFERGEGLPEVSVPRDFVQQILLNFIFNAAEAMERRAPARLDVGQSSKPADPEIGAPPSPRARNQITLVTLSTATLPPELALKPADAAEFIFVSVRDTGSGIAPEIKTRIFEPFFTTKALSTKRGTGLGLSMVYELAKKLEAGLAVESVVGQGSTFTLILPVRETTPTP
ncbi:MAG: ATP-binding protein [Verrucomicrobiota bacterium]